MRFFSDKVGYFFVTGATEGSFVGGAKDDSGGALTSITQNSHVFTQTINPTFKVSIFRQTQILIVEAEEGLGLYLEDIEVRRGRRFFWIKTIYLLREEEESWKRERVAAAEKYDGLVVAASSLYLSTRSISRLFYFPFDCQKQNIDRIFFFLSSKHKWIFS